MGLGLPLRRYLHAPTFILANVAVDLEPFFVLFFGLRYPLYGYLHTFLSAIPMGLVFGYVMYLLEKFLHPLYNTFLFETDDDITPFYPITTNPFYNPSLTQEIYSFCVWMGTFGIICYLGLLGLTIHRKLTKRNGIQASKHILLTMIKRTTF